MATKAEQAPAPKSDSKDAVAVESKIEKIEIKNKLAEVLGLATSAPLPNPPELLGRPTKINAFSSPMPLAVDGVKLRKAEPSDLTANKPLFIRGKRVNSYRLDHPHVYW